MVFLQSFTLATVGITLCSLPNGKQDQARPNATRLRKLALRLLTIARDARAFIAVGTARLLRLAAHSLLDRPRKWLSLP